ncbi:MAG: hypothetical protein J0L56_04410 [Chitinophagales bacterium]|nr:hypothetical protein [Chitinophagales bacterium]
MWLFKKQKKKAEAGNGVSDKVAGKIAKAGIAVQNKFAKGMDKLFAGMNTKRLKLYLIIFCICCGGYSIYLFTDAIVSPDAKSKALQIDKASIPKHFEDTGDDIMATDNTVDEETFHQIQQFKKYLDSLKQSKSYLYDSIITARPFLMDTVLMLEQIYYSQKQK